MMNKIYLTLGFCLAGLSIAFLFSWLNNNQQEISISVTEAPNTYTLSAFYPKGQTENVKRYLDNCLKPASIFRNSRELDQEIRLSDQTRFYIKASEGRLYLKLDKSINSGESIRRIKAICEGINFKGS